MVEVDAGAAAEDQPQRRQGQTRHGASVPCRLSDRERVNRRALAPVAQWIEQRIPNPKVGRSIRLGGTAFKLRFSEIFLASSADLAARRRGLARNAEAWLMRHAWPGNVRELQNVLFRAALRARGASIGAGDLAGALPSSPELPARPTSARVLDAASAGEVSCSDVAASCALSRASAKRVLRALVDAGDLVVAGRGKATRYRRPTDEDVPLDGRVRAALVIARRDGRVTRQALADEAGLATRTAGRVLADLVRDGRLAPDGRRGNGAGYVCVGSPVGPDPGPTGCGQTGTAHHRSSCPSTSA